MVLNEKKRTGWSIGALQLGQTYSPCAGNEVLSLDSLQKYHYISKLQMICQQVGIADANESCHLNMQDSL